MSHISDNFTLTATLLLVQDSSVRGGWIASSGGSLGVPPLKHSYPRLELLRSAGWRWVSWVSLKNLIWTQACGEDCRKCFQAAGAGFEPASGATPRWIRSPLPYQLGLARCEHDGGGSEKQSRSFTTGCSSLSNSVTDPTPVKTGAEGEGVEPSSPCPGTAVFKTAGLNRCPTLPMKKGAGRNSPCPFLLLEYFYAPAQF